MSVVPAGMNSGSHLQSQRTAGPASHCCSARKHPLGAVHLPGHIEKAGSVLLLPDHMPCLMLSPCPYRMELFARRKATWQCSQVLPGSCDSEAPAGLRPTSQGLPICCSVKLSQQPCQVGTFSSHYMGKNNPGKTTASCGHIQLGLNLRPSRLKSHGLWKGVGERPVLLLLSSMLRRTSELGVTSTCCFETVSSYEA